MDFYQELCSAAGNGSVLQNEPMSAHTTFRIGGPADYFVTPTSAEEIGNVIETCRKWDVPYYVMGNGSNLLVGDKGFRGVIIQIFKAMKEIRVEGNRIYAQAGALLSKVAAAACEAELTGIEFASGIPGTLGGAVRMNAGAYGGEMKQVLESATVLAGEGDIRTLSVEEMKMGYRTSIVSRMDYVVLEAVIRLQPGSRDEIRARMEELMGRRREKQPLEWPSAGSTFKRPEGAYAAALIEQCGLKGERVGGAMVSDKHSGFIINTGGATASDVLALIDRVKERVYTQTGFELECEVRMVGF